MNSIHTEDLESAARVNAPRLLVVDDDIVQRSIVEKIGRQAGFQTEGATTLSDSIDKYRRRAYDCVTLDLALGDETGSALLRVMAEVGAVPVIVISGSEQRIVDGAVGIARSLGISTTVIPKPLDVAELRHALSVMAGAKAEAVDPDGISRDQLAAALERHEIEAWLQPKVDLTTGALVGCEALARWRHPTRGIVLPGEFIPAAARTGLIAELTQQIVVSAGRGAWPMIWEFPNFTVAVHASAPLLSKEGLDLAIDRALGRGEVPARLMVLQITLSAAMAQVEKATAVLSKMHGKGVAFSLVDFGTGFFSLSALSQMPISEIRLSRDLVKAWKFDPRVEKVIQAAVHIGHDMGVKVSVAGIETSDAAVRMGELGCDVGQGDFFAPALEPGEFLKWARRFGRNSLSVRRQLNAS